MDKKKKTKLKDRNFPVKDINKKHIIITIKNGGFPPIKYLNPPEPINKNPNSDRLMQPNRKIVNIKELLNNTNTKINIFDDDNEDSIEIKS